MTKPDKNPPKKSDEKEFQDILDELEIEQSASSPASNSSSDTASDDTNQDSSSTEIANLKKLLAEKEEIAKKAQIDYINLKADFDFLVRQTQMKEKTLEQDVLLKVVKKLLPFVEDLRKSLENLTPAQKEEPLGRGVTMVHSKFISALAELQIFPIESL